MKNSYAFISVTLAYFFVGEISKYILDLNTLVYNNLAEHLTIEKVDTIFSQTRKWQLMGYLLLPLIIFIKTNIIAGILSIGSFFFNQEIKHKIFWNITLKAEFIFLLVGVSKIMWFHFFKDAYTLQDVQFFYPLSMLSIIGHENLEVWYIYPLQTINIFEIAYWIILALLVDRNLKVNSNETTGLKIVATSYIPALLIWIATVMFFTLSIS